MSLAGIRVVFSECMAPSIAGILPVDRVIARNGEFHADGESVSIAASGLFGDLKPHFCEQVLKLKSRPSGMGERELPVGTTEVTVEIAANQNL